MNTRFIDHCGHFMYFKTEADLLEWWRKYKESESVGLRKHTWRGPGWYKHLSEYAAGEKGQFLHLLYFKELMLKEAQRYINIAQELDRIMEEPYEGD